MAIEIEFYCAECGSAMCKNVSEDYKKDRIRFDITPCESCLKEQYEKGTNEAE